MNTDFTEWVDAERKKRGWTQTELARRAGVKQSGLSMAINGARNFGPDLLAGVARAFNLPLETVYRLAKYLPPEPTKDERIKEIEYIYSQLSSDQDKQEILEQSRLRLRMQEQRGSDSNGASSKPKAIE
jgi:transcriptional regulator with XRE-family HTH domain